MKIKIKRYNTEYAPNTIVMEYTIEDKEQTLLNALTYIKTNIDNTLTFASGCRSEVCGSCSVRVNGKEVLACKYKVQDGDLIEHIKLSPIKDLVVDKSCIKDSIKKSKGFLEAFENNTITQHEIESYEVQSNCILCASCYSVCPVFVVNSDFIGPFALTKVFKYNSDSREANKKDKIDIIQKNGIWDCTLCGECAFVCPQKIQPNMDIMMLRNISFGYGYADPKFSQQPLSFGGFDPLGGFNPNGF